MNPKLLNRQDLLNTGYGYDNYWNRIGPFGGLDAIAIHQIPLLVDGIKRKINDFKTNFTSNRKIKFDDYIKSGKTPFIKKLVTSLQVDYPQFILNKQ